MHSYSDEPGENLAKLRPPVFVALQCPDCPARVVGLTNGHARALMAIHREGTCQGGGEHDGDGTPPPADPHIDVLRVTP